MYTMNAWKMFQDFFHWHALYFTHWLHYHPGPGNAKPNFKMYTHLMFGLFLFQQEQKIVHSAILEGQWSYQRSCPMRQMFLKIYLSERKITGHGRSDNLHDKPKVLLLRKLHVKKVHGSLILGTTFKISIFY